jgi:ABC-type oligopeptide transport system substrate-binding subunit
MAAGAAAIALLAAGCSSGSSDDDETLPNSISIGIAEPESLIPTNTTEANGSQVLSSLFYPLVRFDEKSEPYTVAADSITHDKANKVWTVKLRPGFTFSNGEPVTADNYINAWDYGAYGPNGQLASYFFSRIDGYAQMQSVDPDGDGPKKADEPKAKKLTGLKKVNDTTFTVTLSSGFAGWESVMGYDAFLPLPKAAFSGRRRARPGLRRRPDRQRPLQAQGQVAARLADPGGEGRRLQGHDPQGRRHHLEDLPGPRCGSTPTWSPGTSTSRRRFRSRAWPRPRRPRRPSAEEPELGLLVRRLPDLREGVPEPGRAAARCPWRSNREEMTEQIFLGSETPATSFVSPVVAGYRPNTCGENCEYNPTKAKQLYTAANGPRDIKISYNQDGGHKAWVDAMCNQIKASLGVNCTGVGEPKFADLLKKLEKKQPVGLIRLGWLMDYPLMENYLGPLYSTDGSSNFYGYSNPAFDSLVREGSEATTTAAAEKKWQQAEDILANDMPVIPLRFGQNVFGHSDKVTNVTMDIFTKVDLYKIEVNS